MAAASTNPRRRSRVGRDMTGSVWLDPWFGESGSRPMLEAWNSHPWVAKRISQPWVKEWCFGRDALKKCHAISSDARAHVMRVYITSIAILLSLAMGAHLHATWNLGGILSILGFVLIAVWFCLEPNDDVIRRFVLAIVAAVHAGASIGPPIMLAIIKFEPSILVMAFVGVAIGLASFLISAVVFQKSRGLLYLVSVILSSIFILVWLHIASSSFMFELYIGLWLFMLYIVLHTQQLIDRAERKDCDYIKHAMTLVLDIFTVLVQLLAIMLIHFIDKVEKKKRKRQLLYQIVFMRDFVPVALALLMKGQHAIVHKFLKDIAHLLLVEKVTDLSMFREEKVTDIFLFRRSLVPPSFKRHGHGHKEETDNLLAKFVKSALGKVVHIDSGLWWIFLLRAYTTRTKEDLLARSPDCQNAMRLILKLCLSEGFDTYPTLLCTDGCCMVDRRKGVNGYPVEIRALFFMALRCAFDLLKDDTDFKNQIRERILALRCQFKDDYWVDSRKLAVYQNQKREHSETAVEKFNMITESVPTWTMDFLTGAGGYFVGDASPARIDFRWFCLRNLIAILSSLASQAQSNAILEHLEEHWDLLIGDMPLNICYPEMETHDWRTVTGCYPKSTGWSHHNGGSWPVLLQLLAAVSVKMNRPSLLERVKRTVEAAQDELYLDFWPEFYEGKIGRAVGRRALYSGVSVAMVLFRDPSYLDIISFTDPADIV